MGGKGSKKKKKNYGKFQKGPRPPPPRLWKKIFYFFFLKLDHFLRTFCKKCIFTTENPKKLRKFFKKMIKLLLDKQIFASSDARFCRIACSYGRYTQNFVHKMRNFSLDMI